MNWKSLMAAAAAFSFGVAGQAQIACGYKTAVTVPPAVTYGASVACAGLTWSVSGLTISTASGCPMFAIVEPRHHAASPTTAETDVRTVRWIDGKMLFFTCRISYLIFIPISSTCEYTSQTNFGTYPILEVVPCGKTQP